MELAYKKLGEGPSLLIIHGLYGMSDNWISIGRELAKTHEVYLVDLRNHGDSPHAKSMTYKDMARDIFVFCNHHSLENVTVVGHSMGGKTAVFFAAQYPDMVKKLIIVDISPINLTSDPENSVHAKFHRRVISTLESLDLKNANTRTELAVSLEKKVGSKAIAQFLMKNIIRDNDNSFSWRLNLATISKSLGEIFKGLDKSQVSNIELFEEIPSLFIKGANSNYLPDENIEAIKVLFPYSQFETIEDAGHWVHAEQPGRFLEIANNFL